MKKPFCSLLMIAALLAGCSSHPALTPGQTESPTIPSTLTPRSPTATANCSVCPTCPPTLTLLPSTATPTSEPTVTPSPAPTGTPTVPPRARLQFHCLAVEESLPAQASVQGVILLQGWRGNPSYRLNMATGEQISLGDVLYMVVSPDGSKLAYFRDVTGQPSDWLLVVANGNGQPQKTIPWDREGNWDQIVQWLDNERLVITKRGVPFYSVLILNPFTGEQKEIITDYPDIVDYPEPLWGSYYITRAIYDPTLTRVLYPHYPFREAGPGIALWDVQAGQAIGHYMISRDYYGQIPKWSPNGQQVAIVVDEVNTTNPFFRANELYAISRDGQVKRLTYLSNQYPEVEIGEYSWSPDGRYIAFWLWRVDAGSTVGVGDYLAILDVETLEVTDYCIGGRWKLQGGGISAHEPVWSPDGQRLVVEYIDLGKKITVILVDLEQGYAAKIAEDLTPVGWMVAP